ncbi:hypothetical protein ABZ439_12690 [Streptomyces sp. NPDC005840]|uniref:hypothetical protein n=1 Tax=Streptomyces sp. NPDC005840 TaxID=3157072 RepID=UPI0034011994
MTNQPYDGPYEGAYDPYQQQQQQQQQAWQGYQGQQGPGDPHAEPQQAQQWQGQTWDTQLQPPVAAVGDPALGHQPPRQYGVTGTPLPAENQSQGHPPHQAYQQPQQAYQAPAAHHAQQQYPQPQYPQQPQQGQQAWPAPAPGGEPAPAFAAAPAAPAAAPAAPGAGYGPATLAGNARVTDAQRARLEGRSPVIEPGMQPAALTALLGLLLAGTAAVGSWALVVPLVALQGLTAAGWFRLNGMWPARQGIALAFLGALVADAALFAAGRSNAPAAILGTIGVWVLLTLVLQLRSHADPDERMYGLMATVTSAALAIMAAGYLGAEPHAVSVGGAAVAVALLARALPLPTPASVIVSLLAAAGAGIAVGQLTDLGAKGALLGAGAAVCALIGHRVASYDYPSRFVHFTAGVALPLTAAAPCVYVLGRALG